MKRHIFIVISIVGFLILTGLGIWQWERRAWKQNMLTEINAGLASAPVTIEKIPEITFSWRPVLADGSWVIGHLIRVFPTTSAGKVGRVYAAPFRLKDGGIIAVELGWSDNEIKGISLPQTTTIIEGVLIPARKPSTFTPDNQPPEDWYWIDPIALTRTAGLNDTQVSSLILRLTNPPEGLTGRQAKPNIPDNHLQYSFTWFGLAIAWLIIAVLVHRKGQQ